MAIQCSRGTVLHLTIFSFQKNRKKPEAEIQPILLLV